ncbi:TNFAIP3-interacting protein 2-like [Megalops cyprinoides]|uniref:TNFAIP3-interacting protein 2-like n=1 Tax=Megalops cyprinoides TaxID=118141 RepID=UPI0018649865|nr:TNFAIP3-interacting protein 2-like [Megalops cyprinoides]
MENVEKENEVLKTKLQSYNTLNTFYHETRQEIASLSHQICKKDNIIADLKARLGRYEKTAVHLEGEEPLVFGPSKSLFDNLCKEIATYKRKLRDAEALSVQQLEKSKLEIQRLQQQVREKDQEILRITHRPQHEKDLEIQQLQRTLAERDRTQATRAVLCSSLAEEADQLRAQLGATVGVCQELLRRLEMKKQEDGSDEGRTPSQQPGECTVSAKAAHLNPIVCKLQEENKVLKQRVAYVESLNAKWQKYDLSREDYVKGLCQRLKEVNVPAELRPANAGMLQQEILRLNRQLEEKMRDCAKLGRELEDVRRKDKEHIQMLEQQVLIYVDDFKSERSDRERAQSKIQDLEEEVLRLKLQLRTQDAKDAAGPVCRVHTGRRTGGHIQTDTAEPLQRNAADQPGASRASGPSTQGPVRTERKGPTDLQCPRCLTSYGDDQTGEFLKHCTECANL